MPWDWVGTGGQPKKHSQHWGCPVRKRQWGISSVLENSRCSINICSAKFILLCCVSHESRKHRYGKQREFNSGNLLQWWWQTLKSSQRLTTDKERQREMVILLQLGAWALELNLESEQARRVGGMGKESTRDTQLLSEMLPMAERGCGETPGFSPPSTLQSPARVCMGHI